MKHEMSHDSIESSVIKKQKLDASQPPVKNAKSEKESDPDSTVVRGAKRKAVAMLMSFYGKDFFGMQVTREKNFPGIEDIFCKYLVDGGLIRQDDYDCFGEQKKLRQFQAFLLN